MLCTKIVFWFCFDIQNNICTQHVLNLYFSCNSMNNLSSYCGLTDSRIRASDTDLPVMKRAKDFQLKGVDLGHNFLWRHNLTSIFLIRHYFTFQRWNRYWIQRLSVEWSGFGSKCWLSDQRLFGGRAENS